MTARLPEPCGGQDLFGLSAEAPAPPIKALTLHQPWASLMAWGAKTIETRGWATAYRGPLAIHAGKTVPDYAREAAPGIPQIAHLLRAQGVNPWTLAGLPLGAVVAIVDLIYCKATDDLGWVPDSERPLGNFAPGRFAWITRNPRLLAPSIPARGHQRLWDWAAPERANT